MTKINHFTLLSSVWPFFLLFLFFPMLAPSLLLMRPSQNFFTKVSTVRGDEVGEEGVEENGQEEWEGKVNRAF